MDDMSDTVDIIDESGEDTVVAAPVPPPRASLAKRIVDSSWWAILVTILSLIFLFFNIATLVFLAQVYRNPSEFPTVSETQSLALLVLNILIFFGFIIFAIYGIVRFVMSRNSVRVREFAARNAIRVRNAARRGAKNVSMRSRIVGDVLRNPQAYDDFFRARQMQRVRA